MSLLAASWEAGDLRWRYGPDTRLNVTAGQSFKAQKTMYLGKRIAEGDAIYIFASENEGGQGLIARGVVTSARAIPRKKGIERQTPRVSISVRRTALAKRRLGRNALKPHADWHITASTPTRLPPASTI